MAVKEKTKILPLSEDVTCAIRWPRNIKIGLPNDSSKFTNLSVKIDDVTIKILLDLLMRESKKINSARKQWIHT